LLAPTLNGTPPRGHSACLLASTVYERRRHPVETSLDQACAHCPRFSTAATNVSRPFSSLMRQITLPSLLDVIGMVGHHPTIDLLSQSSISLRTESVSTLDHFHRELKPSFTRVFEGWDSRQRGKHESDTLPYAMERTESKIELPRRSSPSHTTCMSYTCLQAISRARTKLFSLGFI
jgi:hypothetical protein